MIRNPSINDNKKLQEYKRVTLETLVTTTETKQKRIANLSTKFDEVSTNLAADALSFWALALLFWSWRCLLVELPELINKPENQISGLTLETVLWRIPNIENTQKWGQKTRKIILKIFKIVASLKV